MALELHTVQSAAKRLTLSFRVIISAPLGLIETGLHPVGPAEAPLDCRERIVYLIPGMQIGARNNCKSIHLRVVSRLPTQSFFLFANNQMPIGHQRDAPAIKLHEKLLESRFYFAIEPRLPIFELTFVGIRVRLETIQ